VRVLIAGATGLLGTALSARLEADGDTVVPLRRGTASPGPRWDPAAGTIDPTALDGVDAVVKSSGAISMMAVTIVRKVITYTAKNPHTASTTRSGTRWVPSLIVNTPFGWISRRISRMPCR
jgi:NAD dependent epimerase/dehydratase family enzyme